MSGQTTLKEVGIDKDTLSHPLVADGALEYREYQYELLREVRDEHSVVCLPTGLGKTAVAVALVAERISEGGTALMLAPTKPLVEQHASFFEEALDIASDQIEVFTGDVRPAKRQELWEDTTVVIATPQVVENDLIGSRISLRDVRHLIVDECHRATGDYAYTYVAERYHDEAQQGLVTGMSASPGEDKDAILNICQNIGARNVAVRTENDPSVQEYTYDVDVEWERVPLSDAVLEMRDKLYEVIEDRLGRLRDMGITRKSSPSLSRGDLNKIRTKAQELMDNDNSKGFQAMSIHAEIQKLQQGVKLFETQSVEAAHEYLKRQENAASTSGASKADKRMMSDSTVRYVLQQAEAFCELKQDEDGNTTRQRHAKLDRVRYHVIQEVAASDSDSRVIIFTESRSTVEPLVEFLNQYVDAEKFVGKADSGSSEGMTQRQQKQRLNRFRAGEFDVLVSTSVGEEGLDIPEVDLVIFYEVLPDTVRTVQRQGRTGRAREGAVKVLIGADDRDDGRQTRDEQFYYVTLSKQDDMKEGLETLQEIKGDVLAELGGGDQTGLNEYASDDASQPTGDTSTEDSGTDSQAEQAQADASQPGDSTGGVKSPDDVGGQSGQTADHDPEDDPSPAIGATTEIVIDQRELDADVARTLSKRDGVATQLETLAVGDYILSDRVAIERKRTDDFLASILDEGDRDIFAQVSELVSAYSRPALVIEGDDLYSLRDVHPNAIRGAIGSLVADFGVSVLQTADSDETAELLRIIAAREQSGSDREVSVHGEKQSKTLAEQQEYVVSSIAEIGPVTAANLLEELGTPRTVMNADQDMLEEVEGVGEVTSERIVEVLTATYDG